MSAYHDFLINPDIEDLAGWSQEAADLDTIILDASDWGELKRKIGESRQEADVLVFKGGTNFDVRACEDPRLDIILVTGDSRITQSTAEAASKNNVKIAFDLSQLRSDRVEKMKLWKTDIKIITKHGAEYMVTTNANTGKDIRAPRDIAALINELGGKGIQAVKRTPSNLMREIEERESEGFVNKGVEEV